uniref:AC4 n=1 Tax=Squash leaf curl virus TaxID=10829 RepID=A0A089NFL3_SLCV|nr:AC4 [Squash leaf curl virus]
MFPKKKFLRSFCISRGQSANRVTLESPERNIPTGLRTYTGSFNYRENPTSRMLDFSTSLTRGGLPDFTRTLRLQKKPTPSRTTSPKKVIIVNPGNIKCLGVHSRTKTTYITTPSMQVVREKLSKL